MLSGDVRGLARMGAAVAVRRMRGSHMLDDLLEPGGILFSGMGRSVLEAGAGSRAAP